MDNPATLLTAIMFVTVLAMAIGNLLMALSDIVAGLRDPMPSRLHLSWMLVLLLAALSLFWDTTAILDIADWRFPDFLYTLFGPMLMLFAASVLIAPSGAGGSGDDVYFELAGRFFLMLMLTQLWIVGLDVRYDHLSTMTLVNVVLAVLFAILMASKAMVLHRLGCALAVVGLLIPLGIELLANGR